MTRRWFFFGGRRSGKNALKQQGGRAGKDASDPGPVDPEGWQVGDQAECLARGRWYQYPPLTPSEGPKSGAVLTVVGVTVRITPLDAKGMVCLSFAAWPGQHFDARCFRKLRPRADEATPAEAEFTALVRRKPTPAPPRETIEEFQ